MEEGPLTPGERVAWAIERSGKTLGTLAAKIGCTHATLSQWQTGNTDLGNAKVRLLMAFCEETGVNASWLLTGQGPAIDHYSRAAHPLVLKAAEMVRDHAELTDTAGRLLDALARDSAATT
jgi:transcriptional regulator with XRE-family HTH domain